MKIKETKLPGVLILEPDVYVDERGYFKELFQIKKYADFGLNLPFMQDNYSYSKHGVVRGLHFQKKHPQGKLVCCLSGSIYDVIVDFNLNSPNYGKYIGIEISDKNHRQVWIPPGYAHGFCVLSNDACFLYKCTDIYIPNDEGGILWNDPDIDIKWPLSNPLVSKKDSNLPTLKQLRDTSLN